jgi:hypothetical protein
MATLLLIAQRALYVLVRDMSRFLDAVFRPGVPPTRVLSFGMKGVEFTQAIQFFHFDGSELAQAPAPNSLPLVGGKPTGVLVFVERSPQDNDLVVPRFCRGELRIKEQPGVVLHSTSQRHELLNPKIIPYHLQALNFILPSEMCSGPIHVEIDVYSVDTGRVGDRKSVV